MIGYPLALLVFCFSQGYRNLIVAALHRRSIAFISGQYFHAFYHLAILHCSVPLTGCGWE